MLQHPIAYLVAGPADQTQDRWPVVGISTLAFAFIGAAGRQRCSLLIASASLMIPMWPETIHQIVTGLSRAREHYLC